MPAKRGKAPALKRGDETQRLPEEARVGATAAPSLSSATAAAASSAFDRRPHHLVSRLHPPWNAPASATHAPAQAAGKPTITAAGRGRAPVHPTFPPLTTRMAGRAKAAAPPRDESKSRTGPSPSAKAAAAGHKRPRSASASTPVSVDEEAKEEEEEEEDSFDASDESSVSSSSLSLSPSPMVAESKVLPHSKSAPAKKLEETKEPTGDSVAGNGDADSPGRATTKLTPESAGTTTTSPATDSAVSDGSAAVPTPEAKHHVNTSSDQKAGQQGTSVSAAGSKPPIEDDDDSDRDADARAGADGLHGPAPPQRARLPETALLGELSDRASVTPARPSHRDELLGELPSTAEGRARYASTQNDAVGPEPHRLLGDEPEARTPSLLPSRDGGVSPDLFEQPPGVEGEAEVDPPAFFPATAAAGDGLNYTETLALQDMSLLPEGNTNTSTQGDGVPLLPDYTNSQDTPRGKPAMNTVKRKADEDGYRCGTAGPPHGAQEELLLGDGLVSPPVKRTTATPQQASQGVAQRAPQEVEEGKKEEGNVRSLHVPPPFLAQLSTSSTSTSGVSVASFEGVSKVSPQQQPEGNAVDSLPSTMDDGCWKDDEQTPLRTPPTSVLPGTFVTAPNGTPLPSGEAFSASLAQAAAAAHTTLQETVPIDPFLDTPPRRRPAPKRSGAAPAMEVLSEDSDATPEHPSRATRKTAKSATPPCRDWSASKASSPAKSPTPPRSAAPRAAPISIDVDDAPQHRAHATGNSSGNNGAEIDPALLKVGTTVEGRWGRQWFPAIVTEAPRNGFVQIEWVEDASLLHVRLREVRLPMPPSLSIAKTHAGDQTTKDAKAAETAAAKNVAESRNRAPSEKEEDIMTATQLVQLMNEEDAEDSRHSAETNAHATRIIGAAPSPKAAHERKTSAAPRSLSRLEEKNAEEEVEAVKEEKEHETDRQRRKRGQKRSASPSSSAPPTPPSAPMKVENEKDVEEDSREEEEAADVEAPPSSREAEPLPFETAPSALCIYLPPSVRQDLLQGRCSNLSNNNHAGASTPATLTAASTEVQRNTELQRILHYLSSAGATLVSSLAQADNVAAQLGDGEGHTTSYAPPTSAKTPSGALSGGQKMTKTERSSSLPGLGNGTPSSSAVRRKTVGRVPLPRRSGVSLSPLAAHAASSSAPLARKFFIFLVSSELENSGQAGGSSERTLAPLSDVSVAHALGVSAIQASWLWSVTPGAPHVRLPTATDQVFLTPPLPATADEASLGNERPGNGAVMAVALPLRLTPFRTVDRWLSAKAVEFVERDDAMEMWLNAAGAVVTAEPPPPQPTPPPPPLVSNADEESKAGDPLAAIAAAAEQQRRSASLARLPLHHTQPQHPPRKQPCVEKRPDFVYVREGGATTAVAVDLNRLGAVPVLQVAWVVQGVERHYYEQCAVQGKKIRSVVKTEDVSREELPLLSAVWEDIQKEAAAARSQSRRRQGRSLTPPITANCVKKEESDGSAAPPPPLKQESGGDDLGAATAGAVTVMNVHNETPPLEGNTLLDTGTPGADMRSPDAKNPAETSGVARSSRHVAARQALGKADEDAGLVATPREQPAPNAKLEIHDDNPDHTPALGDPAETVAANGPAAAFSAAPLQPMHIPSCEHPPIAVGEDYYFSVAVPSAAASAIYAAHTLAPLHPSLATPHAVVAATTVALGRVVAFQKGLTLPVASAPPHRPGSPASLPCCVVLMQVYETKFVSMHVDPRSGEVVHQTTVFLSSQRTAVPASALLFDVPVYVVTAAARQHVYLLEEEEEGENIGPQMPPTHLQSHMTVPMSAATSQQAAPASGNALARNRADAPTSYNANGGRERAYYTSANSDAVRGLAPISESASPIPISPLPGRQAAATFTRHNDATDTAVRRWAANVATAPPIPLLGSNSASPSLAVEHISLSKLRLGDSANLDPSVPRTLDVADVAERSPLSAVAARHAVQGTARETPSQRRVSLGGAPRPARLLAQLPLDLEGGRTVTLRPNSHVTFYPRRSLSLSELRPSQANRADSPSDFPITRDAQATQHAPSVLKKTTQQDVDGVDDGDVSDGSEELIAEAPLLGQVELMREMDGMVDIVVHTAQPNSVFGGSKMYRLTPDMILDVSQ